MKSKIIYLKWFDILFLTILMFGIPILSSTEGYLDLINGRSTVNEMLTLNPSDHYSMVIFEAIVLVFALLYLKVRRFDFQTWVISPSWMGIVKAMLIFMVGALSLDLFTWLLNVGGYLTTAVNQPVENSATIAPWWGFAGILFSLLNGFYEEIFFLGICLAVKPEHLKWALIYSLIVRFSFHTYQGMQVALGIGLVYGLIMYVMYMKLKPRNLFPLGLAHSIADVFGLGLISYLLFFKGLLLN